MSRRIMWMLALIGLFAAAPASLVADEMTDEPAASPPAPADDGAKTQPAVPAPPGDADEASSETGLRQSDNAWFRFESPDLRFEQARFADETRILVREENEAFWRVHRGRDLEAIVAANPDLASRSEIAELRTLVKSKSERVAIAAEKTAPAPFESQIRPMVEAPGLLLECLGPAEARLFVKDEDGGERVFIGRDVDAIAQENPELESVSGFSTVRAKAREIEAKKRLALRPDAMAIVEVRHSADGVTLTAFRWRDGSWDSDVFRGNSVDEVVAREAELRALIELPGAEAKPSDDRAHARQGAVTPSERVPVSAERNALPAQDASRRAPCPHASSVAEDRVLMPQVAPGSLAAELGLRHGDVILEIDGRPVSDIDAFRHELAALPEDARPTIVVMREGQRITLRR